MPNFTRKSNRLPFKELYKGGYWYFVTICTQDKICIFSTVEASPSRHNTHQIHDKTYSPILKLTKYGIEIEKAWLNLSNIFEGIYLSEYVIMPNHFHAIIGFDTQVIQKNTNKFSSLGAVISRFKNDSIRGVIEVFEANEKIDIDSRGLNEDHVVLYGETGSPLRFNPHKFWQKSFYDHIIRDDDDLYRIQEYILNNHANWHLDSLNPIKQKMD